MFYLKTIFYGRFSLKRNKKFHIEKKKMLRKSLNFLPDSRPDLCILDILVYYDYCSLDTLAPPGYCILDNFVYPGYCILCNLVCPGY